MYMTQSMRLYLLNSGEKVFHSIQVQQLQSSSTESVFVYLCTCVFVYLFETNISLLNLGAATTIN